MNTITEVWPVPTPSQRVVWDGDVTWFDNWVSDLVANADENNPFDVVHNSDGSVTATSWEGPRTFRPGDTIIRQGGGDVFTIYRPGNPYVTQWGPWFAGWDPATETWN